MIPLSYVMSIALGLLVGLQIGVNIADARCDSANATIHAAYPVRY
jgi:hypothetical protein